MVENNKIEDRDVDQDENIPAHSSAGQTSSAEDAQVSPAGDEPPVVKTRLFKNSTEIVSETLSPTGSVASSSSEPV